MRRLTVVLPPQLGACTRTRAARATRLVLCVLAVSLPMAPVVHAQAPLFAPMQMVPIEFDQAAADLGGGTGLAGSRPAGVAWSELSPAQQQLLGRMQDQWNALPPLRQQALARGAFRWLAMTPQQRVNARQRFQVWQRLPPQQRAVIRQRWRQFLLLPPGQQRAVLQNLRAFSRLPPQERAALRQRWLNATPAQRRQMLQQQRRVRLPGFAPRRGFAPRAGFAPRRFGPRR